MVVQLLLPPLLVILTSDIGESRRQRLELVNGGLRLGLFPYIPRSRENPKKLMDFSCHFTP
jgi:hypothetical protein